MSDPWKVEAAIKLLQQEGYEVFKAAGELELYASHSVDARKYSSYSEGSEESGFLNYIKRDMARSLSRELLDSDLLEFSQPPPEPDGPYYMGGMRMQFKLTFKGFLSKNKEFRRAFPK